MKGFAQRWYAPVLVALASLAVLTLVAVVAAVLFFRTYVMPTVRELAHNPSKIMSVVSGGKMIDVAIFSPAGRTDRHLPAFNGLSEAFSGGYGYTTPDHSNHQQVDEKYQVTADGSGHFEVALHRAVNNNGAETISDLTLPVWSSEPSADKRVKLPDGSSAVAYLQKD
jgi:hypothetical protein